MNVNRPEEGQEYYQTGQPRHVCLWPDGHRHAADEMAAIYGRDPEDMYPDIYRMGADSCVRLFRAAARSDRVETVSVFLASPATFAVQRRSDANLIAVLRGISYLARCLSAEARAGELLQDMSIRAMTLAGHPWMEMPPPLQTSGVDVRAAWTTLAKELERLQLATQGDSRQRRGLLLINYSGTAERDQFGAGVLAHSDCVPDIGLALRTNMRRGFRISDGPVLGLGRAHCYPIAKQCPVVTEQAYARAIHKHIPPRP